MGREMTENDGKKGEGRGGEVRGREGASPTFKNFAPPAPGFIELRVHIFRVKVVVRIDILTAQI